MKILCCYVKIVCSTTVTVVCHVVLCVSSTLYCTCILLVLLLLSILYFKEEQRIHCFQLGFIFNMISKFAVTNLIVTLYVAVLSDIQHSFCTTIQISMVMWINYVVECHTISFVYMYFVSQWNELLCVYVVSEYIQLSLQFFQLTCILATFVVLLLLNVFSCKTVIMKAFILKLGENVGTSFIFSLANFGRSSLNGYVVITTKWQAIIWFQ